MNAEKQKLLATLQVAHETILKLTQERKVLWASRNKWRKRAKANTNLRKLKVLQNAAFVYCGKN